MRRLASILVPLAILSGCFSPGEGLEVPVDQIYFPVGLAMDRSSRHLFVVSSDFDLQYNAGAIQSYRLGRFGWSEPEQPSGLFDQLPEWCSEARPCTGGSDRSVCEAGFCVAAAGASPCPRGDQAPSEQLLVPGRCRATDPKPLIESRVKVGAFATAAVLRARPEDATSGAAERLLVPVRGDSTLHWLDVEDGRLECGQSGNEGACDDRHRAGDDPAQENRGNVRLGAEPFAIDATPDGRTIVVTNQSIGTASLFVDDWSANGPALKFALSKDLPSRPVGIASLPPTASSALDETSAPPPDTFLMTFRNSAQVRVLRFPNEESDPASPFLVDAGGVAIDANSVGSDSRGVAIDASSRQEAERRCAGDDAACLANAALTPVDVYVANRSPASLLIGRTRPPQEHPYFFDSVPLTFGPSRVEVGKVRTASGAEETRVFVICFDSRRIFVYDPQRARIETEILTGRGPHAALIDSKRALLYVAHFTDSYIGVFSLDLASPASYGTMLGTLGTPTPPRSSK